MKKKTFRSLLSENTRLQNQLTAAGKARAEAEVLANSLTTLVAGFEQSNLTSFNPLIQNNIYAPLTIDWMTLSYMYKTHGIIQTAIDEPVLDALRGGLEFQSNELDADDLKKLADYLEEHEVFATLGETATWARLYGGGALILNTGQNPMKPLELGRIKYLELYAANRWELGATYKQPAATVYQPDLRMIQGADYRKSETYRFYGETLHSSRVLTLSGKAAPHIVRWQLQGWGMSEIERMVEDFNIYIKTKNVLYDLLEEAKMDVFRIQDYKSSLATSFGTSQIQARILQSNKLKSFHNALVLDKEDEYEQKQIAFTGIADVMKENRIGMAAAARMPITKLFGMSATGFNSGEDDIENYNAMVESEVREKMRPLVRLVVQLVCIYLFGDAFDIAFSYKPLRVMGAKEEEEVKTSKQNRILQRYDRALTDSKEVGQELAKEKLTSIVTKAEQGLLDEHPTVDDGSEDGGQSGKSKSKSK